MTPWHRFLRWSAAASLIALLALTLMGAARMSGIDALAIQWVEVKGPFQRVSAEQVRAAAAPVLEHGFFGVDPAAVRAAVQSVPWVRHAEVGKRWPDTVTISVVEHEPLGHWGEDRLVSDSGHLFSVDGPVTVKGLPTLLGPESHAPEMVVFYGAMQQRLAGSGFEVTRLERSERGAWRAWLSGGVQLEMGSEDPLPRLERFVAALPQIVPAGATELVRVDLRYAHGFAVSRRGAEEPGELIAAGYE